MKKYISDVVIVVLVIANLFFGALNINVNKPKCMNDDCNRVRVTGTRYCSRHSHISDEREICLRVTSKSSN